MDFASFELESTSIPSNDYSVNELRKHEILIYPKHMWKHLIMIEGVYRLFGKALGVIGAFILFFFIFMLIYWFGFPATPSSRYIPQLFDFIMLAWFAILGIIIAYGGMIINKRFPKIEPFLTKDGAPIHSGRVWKKGSESGLFLTSCGIVLSINQTSRRTSHVGYRLVGAKYATCSDCILGEGKVILDAQVHKRSY